MRLPRQSTTVPNTSNVSARISSGLMATPWRKSAVYHSAGIAMTSVRTMCPMNCHPTLCGMLAEVEDGRLLGVHGDPDNPDSRGFLCIRGQASREIIGNPARVLHPLIRVRRGARGWAAGG